MTGQRDAADFQTVGTIENTLHAPVLGKYAAYYNESRIHRSLNKDAPFHRAIERLGVITSQPVLGGLHHQYCKNLIFGTHRRIRTNQSTLRGVKIIAGCFERRVPA
jgi:hypothetical protein